MVLAILKNEVDYSYSLCTMNTSFESWVCFESFVSFVESNRAAGRWVVEQPGLSDAP